MSRTPFVWLLLAVLGSSSGCSGGDDADLAADSGDVDSGGAGGAAGAARALAQAIDELDTDADFTLILGDASGTFFSHGRGSSSATTVYESASTSKWVTSAVILDLVERGVLSLDDQPQDYIEFWTTDAADPRSEITLTQLLSFTSGLQGENDQFCTNLPGADFADCVEKIYDAAAGGGFTPGDDFYYGQSHMQVAGLMAVEAAGASGWAELFEDFQARTGLFPSGAFDLPSLQNPRLAGGMHWTGDEYAAFLHALFAGELLEDATRALMFTDYTPQGEVTIVSSPVTALGVEWHYDLGNWWECDAESWQPSCADHLRVSSPGAYGAYPFIDFDAGFYGVLSRQGALGSYIEGYEAYVALAPYIEALLAER